MVAVERPSVRVARDRVRRQQPPGGSVGAQLADMQRARLLSATFEVATEQGAGNVTVAHVVERSGVSRRTFYELFEDREDCLLAAFEQALAVASERVLAAYGTQRGWREAIRAGLVALLCLLDEEPVLGRLLIVEALSSGPRTLARRNEAMAQITKAIDAGRGASGGGALPPSSLTAEAIVGGVFSIVHARVAQSDYAPLVELTGPLMSMIALPYLGAAAARRELDRPLPEHRTSGPENRSMLADPFKEAGMRLTYRTVRVLSAIAECPGASNRAIGIAAGVQDQGQISKLLGRVERIGLVANTGLGPGTGAPNSWTLTDRGRQVVHAIRAHDTKSTDGERVCTV